MEWEESALKDYFLRIKGKLILQVYNLRDLVSNED